MYMYIYACMYVCIYVCMYVRVCVNIYISMHQCRVQEWSMHDTEKKFVQQLYTHVHSAVQPAT